MLKGWTSSEFQSHDPRLKKIELNLPRNICFRRLVSESVISAAKQGLRLDLERLSNFETDMQSISKGNDVLVLHMRWREEQVRVRHGMMERHDRISIRCNFDKQCRPMCRVLQAKICAR